MNTLVKMALGKMGRLRSMRAPGPAASAITLPAPERTGGIPVEKRAAYAWPGLTHDQEVLLSQTVGYAKEGA